MLSRSVLFCIACSVALSLASQPACASERTRTRDWRTAGKNPYAPQVQKYVVVTPRPGVATRSHGNAGDGVEYPWQATTLTAPAYPWGWFGARAHPQTLRSRGYYDNYADKTSMGDY